MSFFKNIIEFVNDEYYLRCVLFKSFNLYAFQKNAQERIIFYIFNKRLVITKKRLKPAEIVRFNKKYEEADSGEVSFPIVKTSVETLEQLVSTKKSMSRYGDGEFNLVFGEDLPFQIYNKELANRLKEILLSDDENIMVCVPDMFGKLTQYEPDTAQFWRKYAVRHRQNVYKILDMNKTYYDTQVTRAYIGLNDKSACEEYFDKFKDVWNNKDVVLVEGLASRLGVGNDLFANVNSIERILCPCRNAFAKYDEILETCLAQPKDKLFLLAIGPTATVLAYDLAKAGYRALDIGHLDIEYEWMLQKTLVKTLVKDKYVNEVKGGRKITNLTDEKYLKEIIVNFNDVIEKRKFGVMFKSFVSRMFSFENHGETHYLLNFCGFKIKFPKSEFKKKKEANPYYYYKENNIDITTVPPAEGQIRDIQLANLVLLRELDYVCKENGLKYWLDFGTVLGAVRHKGFIPWDDDIDTGMLREDYDKLIDAFKRSSRNPDIYADFYLDKMSQHFLIKVMHKKSKHLFVDIFPYDFYGEVLSLDKQLKKTEEIKNIREDEVKKHPLYFNYRMIKNSIDDTRAKILKTDSVEHSDLVWGVDYNHAWRNWFSSYDTVFPLKEIEFEGEKFACMNNVEKFLTGVYRDYMAYPKKIGFGHSMFLDLKPIEKAIIKQLIKDKK